MTIGFHVSESPGAPRFGLVAVPVRFGFAAVPVRFSFAAAPVRVVGFALGSLMLPLFFVLVSPLAVRFTSPRWW